MKNLISFIIFILYATLVFFLPNDNIILICIFINLSIIGVLRLNAKNIISSMIKVLPFILFTFIINCFLDELKNAIWIAIKLIIVCNITTIYSKTTTIMQISETIKILFSPLRIFRINLDDIEIMVCISLSMVYILKKDLYEIKNACRAKGMSINIRNIKYILSKFFMSTIARTNQIEEALIAKGHKIK